MAAEPRNHLDTVIQTMMTLATLTVRIRRNHLIMMMMLQLVVDLVDKRNRHMGIPIPPPAVEDTIQIPRSPTATTKTLQPVDPMADKSSLPTETAGTTKTVTDLAIPAAARAIQVRPITVRILLIPRSGTRSHPAMETTITPTAVMVDSKVADRVVVEATIMRRQLAQADLEDKVETLIAMGRATAPAADMVANRVVVGVTTIR